jgi:hypothetical protein
LFSTLADRFDFYHAVSGVVLVVLRACWFMLDSRLRGNDAGMTVPPLRDSMQTM